MDPARARSTWWQRCWPPLVLAAVAASAQATPPPEELVAPPRRRAKATPEEKPPAEDGALQYFEREKTPCATCHSKLVPPGAKPHAESRVLACTDCHVPAWSARRCRSDESQGWSLAAQEAQLCGKCHEVGGGGRKHKPIAEGRCTGCHEPHGSSRAAMLKKEPIEALCSECHTTYSRNKVVHAPVASGECLTCHDSHAGRGEPLLVERSETLCLNCHSFERRGRGRVQHGAVTAGFCVGCHEPHGGPNRGLVKATGRKLCLPCHDAKAPRTAMSADRRRQIDFTRAVVHDPVAEGDCQECHTDKHGSAYPGLLARPAVESCYECHKPFDKKHKLLHGAVKLGDCAECHEPHASDRPGLLAEEDANRLCFRCHEDDVAGRKWVHDPIRDEGCTACHDPHGSNSPMNLKASLEGNELCAGCHEDVGADLPVKHLTVERDGCTVCHDPHGSDTDSGLRVKVNRLCSACHPDSADGVHVGALGRDHKVSGGPDPTRAGREFSCVSCHLPHGSESPKLLRSGKKPDESCKACH